MAHGQKNPCVFSQKSRSQEHRQSGTPAQTKRITVSMRGSKTLRYSQMRKTPASAPIQFPQNVKEPFLKKLIFKVIFNIRDIFIIFFLSEKTPFWPFFLQKFRHRKKRKLYKRLPPNASYIKEWIPAVHTNVFILIYAIKVVQNEASTQSALTVSNRYCPALSIDACFGTTECCPY
ncbi:MAG: hypothetical protein A4E42_01299 [Methanoregulaceae archaeon PtaU1.Bin222]|nr:MAG: hypothetical protein A4E42_01299 [Methanoregulaceae archaeon PtaU1.Bin222]